MTDADLPHAKRLGVLGDTHGRADACRAAIELLQRLGCDGFCHTGDVGDGPGGMAVLDALAGTDCRFVWGNNDFDRDVLDDYALDLDLMPLGDVGRFEAGGVRIVLAHGDDPSVARSLDRDGGADLLLTGHSHLNHDERLHKGAVRWVNPGALYRARPKTVATVELASPVGVAFHEVDF